MGSPAVHPPGPSKRTVDKQAILFNPIRDDLAICIRTPFDTDSGVVREKVKLRSKDWPKRTRGHAAGMTSSAIALRSAARSSLIYSGPL